MAICGPSIVVACQNAGCANYGHEVRIRSELVGGGRVASWSYLTCAACGQVPKQLRGD